MAKQNDEWFTDIAKTIKCPICSRNAKVNMHIEQEEIVDYFYGCECGKIIEQEEIENE